MTRGGKWKGVEDDSLEQETQLCKYLLFPICINIGREGGMFESIRLNNGEYRKCMGLKSISRNGSNWSWIGFNYAAAPAWIVSINPEMSSVWTACVLPLLLQNTWLKWNDLPFELHSIFYCTALKAPNVRLFRMTILGRNILSIHISSTTVTLLCGQLQCCETIKIYIFINCSWQTLWNSTAQLFMRSRK